MIFQKIINNIFRQDFKNHVVLGRSLYGVAVLVMGVYGILNAESYGSYAPKYIPFSEFLAILVGVVFVIAGFFVLADMHLRKATSTLVGLFALFALVIYLPTGNVFNLVESLGFIGAAFLVRSIPKTESKEVK